MGVGNEELGSVDNSRRTGHRRPVLWDGQWSALAVSRPVQSSSIGAAQIAAPNQGVRSTRPLPGNSTPRASHATAYPMIGRTAPQPTASTAAAPLGAATNRTTWITSTSTATAP